MDDPQTPKAETRGLAVLLLVFVTLAVYYPVFSYPFVSYDDPAYIVDNVHVRSGWTWQGVRWAFTSLDYQYNWHPLTWLSHMLDIELFQLSSGWHHATSLALHLLNGLLLLGALRALGVGFWKSFFVAAVFLCHPVRVESVAWVSERKDVLAGTFWMLGLWSYAFYCARPGARRYLGVALFLALGLMSKAMVVTLPFVFLLLDFWPLRRWTGTGSPDTGPVRASQPTKRSAWALVIEKIPLFVLVAVVSAVTVATQAGGGAVSDELSLGQRILHLPQAYLHYLATTLWPVGLAVFYPHPGLVDPESTRFGLALLIGALLVGFSFGVWRVRDAFPALCVGWFWFLGTLVPVIGLVQVGHQGYADRYLYLPGIGLLLMLLAIPDFVRIGGRLLVVSAMGVVLLSASLTAHHQVGYWKSSIALWRRAAVVTERNAHAHLGLAQALGNENRFDEAIVEFDRALEIDPEYYAALSSLGFELLKQGEFQKARSYLEQAISSDPDQALGHFFLSLALISMDSAGPARVSLLTAKRLDPGVEWNRMFRQTRKYLSQLR